MSNSYQQLKQKFNELSHIAHASGYLMWDQSVNMPKGGATARGEQMATLQIISNRMLKSAEMGDLLDGAESSAKSNGGDLSDWDKSNLREMRRIHTDATMIPEDLIASTARANTACQQAWLVAKPNNDFKSVAPHLQENINCIKATAKIRSEKMGISLYDALIQGYDPYGSTADIDPLFEAYQKFLPDFLRHVLDKQSSNKIPDYQGTFSIDSQNEFIGMVVEKMGYSLDFGRIDTFTHPFCSGRKGDIRITVFQDETDIQGCIKGAMHEAGHALYEQYLPDDWVGQPVGSARGMTLHESQSLSMEKMAGMHPKFLNWLAGALQDKYGKQKALEPQYLTNRFAKVEPSLIRIHADEVTYPAHVILRYTLEKQLLSGDISVGDIPTAWNDGMQKMLGITPPDDTSGCLQDIHWYIGAFGYFPSYSLGAMAAAQLCGAAFAQDPNIENAFAKGDLTPLRKWQTKNVHSMGSHLSTNEILTKATGKPLGFDSFKEHLEQRYG